MKKYFHKFVFAVSILGIMGFRECWIVKNSINDSLTSRSGGYRPAREEPASYGEGEIYSIAVGEGGAIYTAAGRAPADWIERPSGINNTLRFVKVYNDTTLSIAASAGDAGTVLQSTDKGESWTNISIAGLTENLYGLDFFYQGTGFEPGLVVCGQTGFMRYSTDFGVSWEAVITPTTENLNSVAALAKTLFIVVGDNGTVIRTSDGGQTWANHTVGGAKFNSISDAIIVNGYGYLWVVGDGGRIYATTNYGISWFPQNSGVTENLYDVVFSNQNDGIVGGANGVVRYTTNGGLLWSADPDLSGLTLKDIVSISKIDENTASALLVSNFNRETSIGTDTTFFLSVSSEPFTDVEDDENLILSEYSLEQNYPNPFNPSTNLSFVISQLSLVTLRVYDLLGREVAVLVNEEKPAGTYEINFDAAGLSSGVYYYQLQATPVGGQAGDEFVETKKLVLLK